MADEAVARWAAEHLTPGTVVQVSGTSKRPAYRLVRRLATNAMGREVLIGEHLNYQWVRGDDGTVVEWLAREKGARETEHAVGNVTHLIVGFVTTAVTVDGVLKEVLQRSELTVKQAMSRGLVPPDLLDVLPGYRPPPPLLTASDLVDVVDADDQVIRTASREEVHARRLRHRFVHVLVINAEGKVLLQQRSRKKARGPGLFDASVGGHVDAGETYEGAARREAAEELGLDPDGDYELLGEVRDEADTAIENMVGRLFLHRCDGPFQGWEEEAERLEWFSAEELRTMTHRFPYLFTPGLVQSAALLQRLGRPGIRPPE